MRVSFVTSLLGIWCNGSTSAFQADDRSSSLRVLIMEKEDKIELSSGCWLEWYEHWGVTLNYVEHSTDHWHSDNETEIDIDAEKAKQIIDFLQRKFNLGR